MISPLITRLLQGQRTVAYPDGPPILPARYRGRPLIDETRCPSDCRSCLDACPTDALIRPDGAAMQVDLGRCLFCTDCADACPTEAVSYGHDHRLAAGRREDLLVSGEALPMAQALDERLRKLFGRSLKLRVVSAGGCNACEADVNVLSTIVFDIGRFGIQFVASPRHADGLLLTGPVTANMAAAVKKAYDAIPAPKLVIATGACAISGGPFAGLPDVGGGAAALVPVDLYIPGCPPHPLTILDGLLGLLGRLEVDRRQPKEVG